MCEWGNTILCRVNVPAWLSHSGEAYWTEKAIDSCIFSLVSALNDAGILTASSCCGHGKRPGEIWLQNGQRLVIYGEPRGFCDGCGRLYGDDSWIDVIVPDDVWKLISNSSIPDGGMLCADCIAKRVARLETSDGKPMFSVGKLIFE